MEPSSSIGDATMPPCLRLVKAEGPSRPVAGGTGPRRESRSGARNALAGACAVFFLVAAWLSLLFPKPANLAKLSQEGKPRPAAVLLGFLGLLATLALPAGAGFAGLLVGGTVALAAEALFAAGALALFPPLLARTAAAFQLRRDAIYLAMREG